jgi:hypothetical protein
MNSSEPRYSAAPRTVRSRIAVQLHEELEVALQHSSTKKATAAIVAFFFVGLRSNALFFFSCCAVLQHCSIFFIFFLAAALQSCRHLPIWWRFVFFALLLLML